MNAKALKVLLIIIAPLAGSIYAQTIPSISWLHQFGTDTYDDGRGVWAAGNIYLAGMTAGVFPGQTSDGTATDGFLVKYDPYGNSQWTSQYGAGGIESVYEVVTDHNAVYTAGTTTGAFPGQTNYGAADFYIRKYDHNGNLLWTQQYGTTATEFQPELAVDATGIYLACQTTGTLPGCTSAGGTDYVIVKYSHDGNYLWGIQVGTTGTDNCKGLYTDYSGVYACGYSNGNLFGQTNNGQLDAFIAKYTPDGVMVWASLFGTSSIDYTQEIFGNESGIFATGMTQGAFPGQVNAGLQDGYIAKYDRDGNQLWIREYGTSGNETGSGISANVSGVYASGFTSGTFPGQIPAIGNDIYACGYSNDGDQLWIMQLGSVAKAPGITPNDYNYAISVVSLKAYITGFTNGLLPGQTSPGGSDAYVIELQVQTPQEATQDLITAVGYLVASGVLNQGQGNALTVKLQAALQKMNQGNYNAAINNLNAFINQVNAFLNAGILSVEEADDLIIPAQRIIYVLEDMLLKGQVIATGDPGNPADFQTYNYPNPFNSSTMIRYTLPDDLYVTLNVFDCRGKKVLSLIDGMQGKGEQNITLNADGLPDGVYYYRLQAGSHATTKKLIVLK